MANRESCSYHTNIKCDISYELSEFYRQLGIAFAAKQADVFPITGTVCPCKKELCPRYLSAQQKQR